MRDRCFPFCLTQHKSVSWQWIHTQKNKTVISSYKVSTLSIWWFLAMYSISYQSLLRAYEGEGCCLPLFSGRQKKPRLGGEAAPEIPLIAGLWLAQGLAEEQWQRVGLSARSCLGCTHQQTSRWQALLEKVFLSFLSVEIQFNMLKSWYEL